ncbi:Acg family FMN-binding oxidoreductase [Actinoplanes awajinensis]|uniref:Nitroreductase n=1 Tax=Actinoplanes awajinensis subsp. mycoplanecinus TaxID=135947 RepID=A0A101JB34_9ACTN|nr:nitroreductase family protein [Actinoplanes awajinensis]KUL23524.1 nitroreductase [Actinoplanes awajinensis subsp. mycoplanecinus]
MTMSVPPARGILTECVRVATAAPSLHNSQPWLFRIVGAAIEVYADPSRRLPVADPDGREQMLSVGAAVFTLRVAVRSAGYAVRVEGFPSAENPALAARVTAVRPTRADRDTETLAAAIPHRHTNRAPFANVPVPPEPLRQIRAAARREGAALTVADAHARDAILEMARSADRRLKARPDYLAELSHWTGSQVRHDGVPSWAVGPWDALETVPIRDFGQFVPGPRTSEPFEPHPTIVVLATDSDTPRDWLRAGQALQRVLLTATWLGLATTPISQPVEVPSVRRMLTTPPARAQMVLRIGYGRMAGRTPRRPLTEVLLAGDNVTGRGTGGVATAR